MNKRIIVVLTIMAVFCTTPVMAKKSFCDGFFGCAWKVAKKATAPIGIISSAAVGAYDEYDKGGDTLDIIGGGLAGGASRAASTIVETAEDIGTVYDMVTEDD